MSFKLSVDGSSYPFWSVTDEATDVAGSGGRKKPTFCKIPVHPGIATGEENCHWRRLFPPTYSTEVTVLATFRRADDVSGTTAARDKGVKNGLWAGVRPSALLPAVSPRGQPFF